VSTDTLDVQAKTCPVCGNPKSTILTCPTCWQLVPRYDQIGFRRMFVQCVQNKGNPKSYASKADMIVRNARAALAAKGGA
jgi:hypothetical protein